MKEESRAQFLADLNEVTGRNCNEDLKKTSQDQKKI